MAKFNSYDDDYRTLQHLMRLTLRMAWLNHSHFVDRKGNGAYGAARIAFVQATPENQDEFMQHYKRFFTTIHDAVLDGMGVRSKLKLSEAMIALESYARNVQHKVPAVSNNGLHEVELEEYISPCLISRVKLPLTANSMRCYIDLSDLRRTHKNFAKIYNVYNPYTRDHFPTYNNKHQQIPVPFKPAEALIKERHFVLQHRHGDKDKVAAPDATNTLFSMLTVELDCRKLQLTVMQHQHRPPRILPPSEAPIRVVYRGANGPCKAESAYSAQIASFQVTRSNLTNVAVNVNTASLSMKRSEVSQEILNKGKAKFKTVLNTDKSTFSLSKTPGKTLVTTYLDPAEDKLVLRWTLENSQTYEVQLSIQMPTDRKGYNIEMHSYNGGSIQKSTIVPLSDNEYKDYETKNTVLSFWKAKRHEVINQALAMLLEISKSQNTMQYTVVSKAMTGENTDDFLYVIAQIKTYVFKPLVDHLSSKYGDQLSFSFDSSYGLHITYQDDKGRGHEIIIRRHPYASTKTIVAYEFTNSQPLDSGNTVVDIADVSVKNLAAVEGQLKAKEVVVINYIDSIISKVSFPAPVQPYQDSAVDVLSKVQDVVRQKFDSHIADHYNNYRCTLNNHTLSLQGDRKTTVMHYDKKQDQITLRDIKSAVPPVDLNRYPTTDDPADLANRLITAFLQMDGVALKYADWVGLLSSFEAKLRTPQAFTYLTNVHTTPYLTMTVIVQNYTAEFFVDTVRNEVIGKSSERSHGLQVPISSATTAAEVLQQMEAYFTAFYGHVSKQIEALHAPPPAAAVVIDDDDDTVEGVKGHDSKRIMGSDRTAPDSGGTGPAQGSAAQGGGTVYTEDDFRVKIGREVTELFKPNDALVKLMEYETANIKLQVQSGPSKGWIFSVVLRKRGDWNFSVSKLMPDNNPEFFKKYELQKPSEFSDNSFIPFMQSMAKSIHDNFLVPAQLGGVVNLSKWGVAFETMSLGRQTLLKFEKDIMTPLGLKVLETYGSVPLLTVGNVDYDIGEKYPTLALEVEIPFNYRYNTYVFLSHDKRKIMISCPMLSVKYNKFEAGKLKEYRYSVQSGDPSTAINHLFPIMQTWLNDLLQFANNTTLVATTEWTRELFMDCITKAVYQYLEERFSDSFIMIASYSTDASLLLWDKSQIPDGQSKDTVSAHAGLKPYDKTISNTINAILVGDFKNNFAAFDLSPPHDCSKLITEICVSMEAIAIQLHTMRNVPLPRYYTNQSVASSAAPSMPGSPRPVQDMSQRGVDPFALLQKLHQIDNTSVSHDFGHGSSSDETMAGPMETVDAKFSANDLMLKLNFDL